MHDTRDNGASLGLPPTRDDARALLVRGLYSALLYLLAPAVPVRLLWRSRRVPGYRRRWAERLGLFDVPELRSPIWIHAVSVGEVEAAAALIGRLRERFPERSLVVTTTTPTGSERVAQRFAGEVFHVYLPYDLPGAVKRFLARIRPALAIVMETELWPNLFNRCRARAIPLMLVNARLSPRSCNNYRRLPTLVRATLARVTLVAAQSEADARRFVELGAARERVRMLGNLKFDLSVPTGLAEQAARLKRRWGQPRPVWAAASTHPGEDEPVLEAFARVREAYPACLLILVPRHPERAGQIVGLCRRHELSVVRRSHGDTAQTSRAQVLLGDTFGELSLFYALADVAFVGGSLVPIGGHNMLEAAALGVPVLSGPHRFNFAEIERLLRAAGAAWRIADSAELAAAVIDLLGRASAREAMGQAGRNLVARHRGASERVLAVIEGLVGGDPARALDSRG